MFDPLGGVVTPDPASNDKNEPEGDKEKDRKVIVRGSFLPKRTQVSACPTPISPKLILWVGGSCDMTKCKGHPLEVFCCGDIIGYFCDLFLGHYVFDALYLVYLSISSMNLV